jgi:hypothetical protein
LGVVALSLTLAQYSVVEVGAVKVKVTGDTPVCGLAPERVATVVVSEVQVVLEPL